MGENGKPRRVGFVHRRPLVVSEQCMEEGHLIGIALFVTIAFNLALANHLKAISSMLEVAKQKFLRRALKLYELAISLHAEHCIQDSIDGDNDDDERERSVIGSLRFMFIASNN